MSASLAPGHSSLHVSGINRDWDEKKFLEYLQQQIGADNSIDSVYICRDWNSHKSRGAGYINASIETCEKIKSKLNHKLCCDRELNITYKRHEVYPKEANLFFNNLNVETTYDSFEKLFTGYQVFSTKLRPIGNIKKVGIVQFVDIPTAEAITKKYNQQNINGFVVKIGPFLYAKDRAQQANSTFNSIFVKNFEEISKENLEKIFKQFGDVQSVYIFPKPKEHDNLVTYCANITFTDHEGASKALAALDKKSLENQKSVLLITRFMNKQARKFEYKSSVTHKPENNTFMTGFPEDTTYQELKEILSKFGEIDSLRIMMREDDPTKSKGYAYCSFVSNVSATNAKNNTGMPFKGGNLAIKPFISAEQRRSLKKQGFSNAAATKFNKNRKARNNAANKKQVVTKPVHAPVAAAIPPAQTLPAIEAISQADLDAMDEEDKHETFGEKIYEYVAANFKENPGKITGMILESFKKDYNALNNVIANGKIIDKINEAIEVLKKHSN